MTNNTITRTLRIACASLTIAAGTLAPFAHADDLPQVTKTPGVSLASTALPTELLPGMLAPQDPKAQMDPSLLRLPEAPLPAHPGVAPQGAEAEGEVGFNPDTRQAEVHPAGAKMLQDENIQRDKSGALAPPSAGQGVQAQAVFGSDDRVWISNTWEYPWRTQCKLIITFPSGHQFVGSGTLVGSKYVLTAGHCTYEPGEGGWASSIEVIPGLSGTYKPYGSFWAVYMRSYTGWTSYQDSQHDFALLTLNYNIGSYIGWLGYAYYSSIWGLTGNLAGYPADLYGGIWQYFAYGACYDGEWFGCPQQVIHWIDSYGGNSGSGIYKVDSYGNRYVFCIHAWHNAVENGATKITSQKFDSIANWIASGY